VYHAANVQRLVKLCHEHNIIIQCYGPLNPLFRSTGGPVDALVEKIAKEKSATASQVLIAWAAQHSGGMIVT
jgi:diketogulonate reductase-like aldo/keto reductase